MKAPSLLRVLASFLRGVRPIRHSLSSISHSLHTLARVAEARLSIEHGYLLPDEELMKKHRREALTEVSYVVKEPVINPETGKPIVEDDDWSIDPASVFGNKEKD